MNKISNSKLLYISLLMIMSAQASAVSMNDYMVITTMSSVDGDAAITTNGKVSFSNSDVHA